MGLFGGSKNQSLLGVDIGSSGIKIVEISNVKGRAKLMTYGYTEIPSSEGGDVLFENTKQAGSLLADMVKQSGVQTNNAMAALPVSKIFSTIISVPKVTDKKHLKSIIDVEIEKLAPLPLSEMITYTTFLDDKKNNKKDSKNVDHKIKDPKKAVEKVVKGEKKKYIRVLVTGASKTLVQKYIEIFKYAKLELSAIDTEAFALIRSLIGKDKSSIMIIDIGSKKSNIIVVEKGVPFVSRSVNIGGDSITDKLKDQMKLEYSEAERFKRDLGQMAASSDLPGGLPNILEPFMQPLVNEIRYAMKLHSNMELSEQKNVEKIVLTGGSSHLPRIVEYLTEILNMNIYIGDPFARIEYPKDLSGVLDEIGPRLSLSIGLGMRDS